MKKQVFTLMVLLISFVTFGQKSEVKAIAKAFKSGKIDMAISAIEKADTMFSVMDDKTKSQFLYYKGLVMENKGDKDAAADSFKGLIELENKLGKDTYSSKIAPNLQNIIIETFNEAITLYNNGAQTNNLDSFKNPSTKYEAVYNLSNRDTIALENAAKSSYYAKDHKRSIDLLKKLIDMGYTGKSIIYSAESILTDDIANYSTEKEMKNAVAIGTAKNPKIEIKPSVLGNLYSMMANNYLELEDTDKALEFITKARELDPENYSTLIDQANIYLKLGKKEEFKSLMQEALKVKPEDPTLHFNIGVMNMNFNNYDVAEENFKNALKYDPEYFDAYNNLGNTILKKADPIIEDMNANLSNFKKYDELQSKQFAIYKEALPYFEKAFSLKPERKDLQMLINKLKLTVE
jgi:tetratricopeptide (TPR) repeat protein